MALGDIVKGLETRHEESAELLDSWELCNDCREGQKAIHSGGIKYLPKLSGQTDSEYESYKKRAVFFGAYSRTVDAFQGMLLRVVPQADVQSDLLNDVTGQNVSLYEFAETVTEAALVEGFGGILVEHTPQSQNVRTLAQSIASGARPYLTYFDAESIVSWREGIIGNKKQLIQVVLEENEYISSGEFEHEERDTWRVLDLDEVGNYRQRVFVKSKQNENEYKQITDDIYPLKNGGNIREIPFFLFGDVEELPPLIDLADLNVSHYQSTADLENGCHYTALPTPIVSGVVLEDGQKLYIGSSAAWVFPQPDAKASYLEFQGQGLQAIEKRIESKEKQMSVLGARMLSDVAVAETATGAGLRSSGEFSVLAQMANGLSKVLSRSCSFMLQWVGEPEVAVKFNTDFMPNRMTAQELQANVAAWQSGAISYQSLYANLKQGSVLMQENAETELAMIGNAAPIGTDTLSAPSDTPIDTPVDAPSDTPSIDMATILEAIKAMQPQEQDLSAIVDAIKAIPAPVVNVAAPVVDMQPVADAIASMPQPVVEVPPVAPEPVAAVPRKVSFTRDAAGNIAGATIQ